MKNIHIIPTDKPSRFQKTKHDNFFLASKIELYTDCIAQNIYITNDEEIKEGDWTFDGENPYKWTEDDVEDCLCNPGSENYKGCKKIILTTDQDLIKDGVQVIDDEFLEWFVKNTSCEFVEYVGDDCYREIIIPKKEPKQVTLEEAAEKYIGGGIYLNEPEKQQTEIAFYEGAKWQQERSYSEEDLIAFYNFLEDHQLRKYGDVWKRITNDQNDKPLNFESVDDQYIIEWFEQFKKK